MNPGQFNHRIKFTELVASTPGATGAVTVNHIPVVCSQTAPTDTTWGSLEPIKQWNQVAIEAGASVLNGDRVLVLRYRDGWQPTKNMIFEDMEHPGDVYTVHSILPYYPGSKSTFQNKQTLYERALAYYHQFLTGSPTPALARQVEKLLPELEAACRTRDARPDGPVTQVAPEPHPGAAEPPEIDRAATPHHHCLRW